MKLTKEVRDAIVALGASDQQSVLEEAGVTDKAVVDLLPESEALQTIGEGFEGDDAEVVREMLSEKRDRLAERLTSIRNDAMASDKLSDTAREKVLANITKVADKLQLKLPEPVAAQESNTDDPAPATPPAGGTEDPPAEPKKEEGKESEEPVAAGTVLEAVDKLDEGIKEQREQGTPDAVLESAREALKPGIYAGELKADKVADALSARVAESKRAAESWTPPRAGIRQGPTSGEGDSKERATEASREAQLAAL